MLHTESAGVTLFLSLSEQSTERMDPPHRAKQNRFI